MIAITIGMACFVILVLGGETDKSLTAWDALFTLGVALLVAGVSDLWERYR